jgi:hypothetical protein
MHVQILLTFVSRIWNKNTGRWEFVICISLLWLYVINCSEDSGHYMYRTVVIMYRTVVTICTTSLTLSNYMLCPHSCIYVFCVDISEQTAIISLYNINWLVFIIETECVYCAVRTGYLNIFQVKLNLQYTFIFILLLPEGRAGKTWEPSN